MDLILKLKGDATVFAGLLVKESMMLTKAWFPSSYLYKVTGLRSALLIQISVYVKNRCIGDSSMFFKLSCGLACPLEFSHGGGNNDSDRRLATFYLVNR